MEALGRLRRCNKFVWTLEQLPSRYITLVTLRPAKLLLAWTSLPVLLVSLVLLINGVPKIETDLTSSSYLRADGPIAERFDALAQALALIRKRKSSPSARRLASLDVQKERKYAAPWSLKLYYTADDIFDAEVIEAVHAFEKRLESLPSYHRFCLFSSTRSRQNSTCSRPVSAMNFFYGRQEAVTADGRYRAYRVYADGSSSTHLEIEAVARAMGQAEIWNKFPEQPYPRTWYFDEAYPRSKVMQTKYTFGVPLPGFRNRHDRPSAQQSLYRKFVVEELLPLLQFGPSSEKVTLNYEGLEITGHEIKQVLLGDAAKACVSILLVYIYMAIYTGTPLVALLGMATVVLSLPFGTALFVALGHSTLPAINFLALFLLTGIGADHLFVFMNAWRQTKRVEFDDVSRLRLTFRRAGKSITAAGTTTALSFLTNLFSAVQPLRQFGLFVGLCVLANLVLALGMFPCVLLLRERTKQDNIIDISANLQTTNNLVDMLPHSANARTDSQAFDLEMPDGGADDRHTAKKNNSLKVCRKDAMQVPIQNKAAIAANLQENSDDEGMFDRVIPFSFAEHFFGDLFAPCLYRRRWLACASGLVVTLSCFLIACLQFRASQKTPAFLLPGSHNLADLPARLSAFDPRRPWTSAMEREPLRLCEGNCTMASEEWHSASSGRQPAGGLGVLSGTSKSHGVDRTLPNSQAARIDMFFGLRGRPIHGDINSLSSSSLSAIYDESFDFGSSGGQIAVRRLCDEALKQRERLALRSVECFLNDFRNFLHPSSFPYVPAEEVHARVVDFIALRQYEKRWEDSIGFVADEQHHQRVRWVRVTFIIDVSKSARTDNAAHWFNVWEEFVAERNSVEAGTHGVGTMFHSSSLWVRFDFETRLVGAAFLSAFLSIVFALLAVLLFFAHVAIATYIMFVNVSTIVCLAGTLFGILGWDFGTVEAVGLIIVVGLSLDYSLHLAESYLQSEGNARYDRVQDALRKTGSALLGAAGTSMVSCPPILFCTIQVFVRFGIVIIISMGLSLLSSLIYFAAMLFIMGPVDDAGSVRAIVVWLTRLLCGEAPAARQIPAWDAAGAAGEEQGSLPQKPCMIGNPDSAPAQQTPAVELSRQGKQ